MKKIIIIIVAVVLVAAIAVAAVFLIGGLGGASLDGLVLVKNGKAQFRVVTTSAAGGDGVRAANNLVTKLRELGVDVDDVTADSVVDDVSDCEIIIGTGAKNRPEECNVSVQDIGERGEFVKVIGKRVVIAGGTGAITRQLVEDFMEEQLGITDDTESLKNAAVPEDLEKIKYTEYNIKSLSVGGVDITDYIITYDVNDKAVYPAAVELLTNSIGEASGKWLKNKTVGEAASTDKQIIIRTVENAGEDGFRIIKSGGNIVIECALPNMLLDEIGKFLDKNINDASGNVDLDKAFPYSRYILTASYKDFGVVGDGSTNDFLGILKAHETVNQTKQKLIVEGEKGKTFLIEQTWTDGSTTVATIPIQTSVDFTGATFIINDQIDGLMDFSRHKAQLFKVIPDVETKVYNNPVASFSEDGSPLTLKAGDSTIPWLAGKITEQCYVSVAHTSHTDFMRYGGRETSGAKRNDVMIVNPDGTIVNEPGKDTRPVKDFPVESGNAIGRILIRPVNDTPIEIKGGKFITYAAKSEAGKATYKYVGRGISIERSNTTIIGIDHEVQKEPTAQSSSYPYSAFVEFLNTYNSTLKDSILDGHRLDKDSQGTSNMGSYDLSMGSSVNIYIKGLKQHNNIKNSYYWGLMGSNYCKNMFFEDCIISRIDAHAGVYNIDVKNCTIGLAINLIGGGTCNMEKVTRRTGEVFINLRRDYGATWNGDINLTNCTMDAKETESWNEDVKPNWEPTFSQYDACYIIDADVHHSNITNWAEWDFGFECRMPKNVNLDGFTVTNNKTLYVFERVPETVFTTSNKSGTYRPTELVTYKNMSKPAISNEPSTTLSKIKIQAG